MSKLIRVNINLDNSHSLTDFPVDIYSGTTTGNTTNLVYAGVTTSPVTFTVDDSIIEFGLKLVSTGCLDQVLLIESPSVDCEICADFVEFFDPVPTPQTTQTVLESCINDLTFVVEYNNSGLNGSPCSGGHGCNRAVFDILANSVVLGQVNLNNGGGIHDDVNRPPTYPNYPGASSGDRYNALSITSQQAQSIASNSPNGLIDFSFDCACIWSGANQNCVGSSCHTDVSWVRIIKDMGLSTEEELYNGCPNGNFIEDFDPCPPQPSPTPSSSPVPNASPTPSSSPAPNSSPTPSPTPSSSPAPNASPTPSPTPSSSPAPNASPTPSPSATASPTPTPSPSTAPETTEISAILLCNTTSGPNNANCDEGNDGVLENRVFVLYNTTWFTTNASGKNVVKSTFSLTDNEIINGGDSSYTIHPDSIWTGGPSVFRNSSDGTYMISDNSTEGAEKLLFQKNGNFGTTNKCGGGPGGF